MATINSPRKSKWNCVYLGKTIYSSISYEKAKKWLQTKEGLGYEIVSASKNRDCVLTIHR